ncbi:MAG TPA: adenylate/guanylate cyclase domain-containing protein [Stellaceae bacterium]|nr:adenylate/guanylate cyclase domain-containing protein [Stellaceae bacterium]
MAADLAQPCRKGRGKVHCAHHLLAAQRHQLAIAAAATLNCAKRQRRLSRLARGRTLLSAERVERRLAAILAADVAGYSRLMGQDEAGTLARLRTHRRELIDPKVAEHKGRVVKTTGDGILTEFPSVVEAVACAVAVQQGMAERNAVTPEERRIIFRVGINLGDVIVDDGDIHGDGVNVAARLEGIAEPGGICVSAVVHEQVRGRLNCAFDDLGEQALKNINRAVRVYRVRPAAVQDGPKPAPTDSRHVLPLPDKPSIAVLPFQNMSGDPEQEYFADGMVEEITTALSRFRWLFVIARNSSFTYKGQAVDVKQVGRELGVRYVLEGSVRRGGNRVRVTTQLIDALSGAHVWAERYDCDLSDIFAVQDEITASVAGVIEPALTEAEQWRALRKPTDHLDAWEAYQRGMWHFNKHGAEENRTAQGFFRQAMAIDPDFAPAHYGFALALQWDVWHYSTRSLLEVQGPARAEASRAVTLDDKDAMGHAVLAHMLMWGGEWKAAIAEARTALALNLNSAFVISMLGCVLSFGGYREEALDRLRQAMRASPHDPLTWLWLGWVAATQLFARDFDAAAATWREVIRLRPTYILAYGALAASLAHRGRIDEAREVLDRAQTLFPEQAPRLLQQERFPWLRPEDHALRLEGLRLALGEAG